MKKDEIKLENGKYTFYMGDDHCLKCDRYNEEWRDFIGDGAILALFIETLNNQKKIDKIIELINIHVFRELDITYDPDTAINDVRKIIKGKI